MSYERIHMTPIRTRIKAFTRARFINVIINVIFTRKGCHLVSFINGANSLILPLNTVIKVENNLWDMLLFFGSEYLYPYPLPFRNFMSGGFRRFETER